MTDSSVVPATVRAQADDGSCSVLLDDGTLVEVPSAAVAAGRFRMLRPGQRVALHRDDAGTVVLVDLP